MLIEPAQWQFSSITPQSVTSASQHVSLHEMHGNIKNKVAHDSTCTSLYFFYILILCLATGEAHITGFYSSTNLNYHPEGNED